MKCLLSLQRLDFAIYYMRFFLILTPPTSLLPSTVWLKQKRQTWIKIQPELLSSWVNLSKLFYFHRPIPSFVKWVPITRPSELSKEFKAPSTQQALNITKDSCAYLQPQEGTGFKPKMNKNTFGWGIYSPIGHISNPKAPHRQIHALRRLLSLALSPGFLVQVQRMSIPKEQ